MLEFRRIFGRECARYAAVRATPETIARLEAVADKAERSANMLELFELDFEFYVALTQAAGNQVMGLLINTVRDGVRSYMPMLSNLAPSAEVVRKHHRELIAAVRAKDFEKAMRVADEYLKAGAEMAARLGGIPALAPLPQPPL